MGPACNWPAGSVKPGGIPLDRRPVLHDQKALKDEADGTKVIVTHSMWRKSQIIIFELVEALVCGRGDC